MSDRFNMDGARNPSWEGVAGAFRRSFSTLGLTLAPARGSDCLALAPSVGASGKAGALGPAEALAGLARRGVLHSAFDENGSIVGLGTVRPHLGQPLLGWAVLPDRIGERFGERIASAMTAHALSNGARTVWCEAGVRNAPALAALDALGFLVEMKEAGLPVLFRVDGSTFRAFRDEGPRDRRRAMSERCAPLHPDDWKRRAPTPREILGAAFDAGDVTMRLAGPGDEDVLVDLAPFGVVPSGHPEGVRAFVRAMAETQTVLIGSGRLGEPVGSVTVGINSLGRHEIGWVVTACRRGNGYATEMAEGVLARLFDEGIDEVDCSVDAGNHASLRVAAKLGFEVSGLSDDSVVEMTLEAGAFSLRQDRTPTMAA